MGIAETWNRKRPCKTDSVLWRPLLLGSDWCGSGHGSERLEKRLQNSSQMRYMKMNASEPLKKCRKRAIHEDERK